MRIALYREWLRLSRLNRQLSRAGQPSLTVIPVESRYEGIIYWLSKNTELTYFEPDQKIVEQGHRYTEFMYVIQQGNCSVSVFDQDPDTDLMRDYEVRELNESDYFGEVSMVHDSVRSATVTTKNYCTIGLLEIDTIYEICSNYPFFKESVMENITRYDDQLKIFLMTALRDIEYLADCEEETIQAIALSMKFDWLEPGIVVYGPGETQMCMSIIQTGQIELTTIMDNDEKIVLERLGRGAILGAYTFLVEDQNYVTATCTTATYIYTIERKLFTRLI